MNRLESRLARLEQRTGGGAKSLTLILSTVSPKPGKPKRLCRIKKLFFDGRPNLQFLRAKDESDAQFLARVRAAGVDC